MWSRTSEKKKCDAAIRGGSRCQRQAKLIADMMVPSMITLPSTDLLHRRR